MYLGVLHLADIRQNLTPAKFVTKNAPIDPSTARHFVSLDNPASARGIDGDNEPE